MTKRIKIAMLVLLTAAVVAGAGALLTPQTSAASSTCWQVDCNTCCKAQGKVICTQRACP